MHGKPDPTKLLKTHNRRERSVERVLAGLFRRIGNDDKSGFNPRGKQIARRS